MATVVSMTWEELLENALQLPSDEKRNIARACTRTSRMKRPRMKMRIPPKWRRPGRRRSSVAWRRSRTVRWN
jgi:hypothetical protein